MPAASDCEDEIEGWPLLKVRKKCGANGESTYCRGCQTLTIFICAATLFFVVWHYAREKRLFRLEAQQCPHDPRFQLAANRRFDGLQYEEEQRWRDFDFIQLADPQLGMFRKCSGSSCEKSWAEELHTLKLAVQHANRLRPRFVLISGDLADAYPSAAQPVPPPCADPREGGVRAQQLRSFKAALRSLDPQIPLVLQPGNHDLGQQPLLRHIAEYRLHFGDDYFCFWVGGVLFVAINSQYYTGRTAGHAAGAALSSLGEAQDEWLLRLLRSEAARRARHVAVLSHVPPFVDNEAEEEGWANWELKARRKVLQAASEAGVRLWLSGHFHSNVITRSSTGIPVVVSSSCCSVINWTSSPGLIATQESPDFTSPNKVVGSPPLIVSPFVSGARLVRVAASGFEHRWFPLAHMPSTFDEAFAH
eukprot:CAMPEP_0119305612 /NCGR_PEP_ID=MMETSP1333-20130426/6572_1 /TAXON_ID=418940 /ORGANISM="Scyphosphaera apsteinii, Strain RCC1455" /LENGTH=418 /DNA_ID=CAMNT_0007308751 /DNA_START=157 /DNA_END=1413 /DNA_ORIENTATION=-